MKRVLLPLAAAALLASLVYRPWGWAFAIGVHPYPAGTPWTYQLWSGFLPGLTIASLCASLFTYIRQANCHVHGCWRTGRYPVAGGMFKVCKPHHPDENVRDGLLAEHVHLAHWRLHGGIDRTT